MKAAIYIRVSTKDQEEKNQIPAIHDLIQRKYLELFRTYSESASAWKTGHQKEFKKLMADARSHEFQILVVWSLDRLTREGPLRLLQIFKSLAESGVMVLSVQEPWTDIPTEFRDVMLSFYGFMARFESQRRSERTKAGIARKKAGGGKVGRKPGSKDTKKRSNEGYLLRQARERVARAEAGDL